HEELRFELAGQLERDPHRLVAVRRAVDADEEAAVAERLALPHDEHVLLDSLEDPGDDAAELAERLTADAVSADGEQVVRASRRTRELLVLLLVLRDQPAVL